MEKLRNGVCTIDIQFCHFCAGVSILASIEVCPCLATLAQLKGRHQQLFDMPASATKQRVYLRRSTGAQVDDMKRNAVSFGDSCQGSGEVDIIFGVDGYYGFAKHCTLGEENPGQRGLAGTALADYLPVVFLE